MILSFHPCFGADHHIVLADRHLKSEEIALIAQARAIILPQARPEEIYTACTGSGAVLFPNYDHRFAYPGKAGQSLLFEKLGCPHPATRRWPSVRALEEAHPGLASYPHAPPFVIKADRGHEGEGVYIAEDRNSFLVAVEHLARKEGSGWKGFVTQEYVPSGGNVLRAVILGRRIVTYWKRPARPDAWVTTISRGAMIDYQWRPELQAKGARAARRLAAATGIDLAAIDFVCPEAAPDPEPLFLEINYYFGRRGLGGSERYYAMVHEAIREWLSRAGLDPDAVWLL